MNLTAQKKELIDHAFKRYSIRSVAELGCTFGVDCAYGLYIAERYGALVTCVDEFWPDSSRAACAGKNIITIQSKFSEPGLMKRIGKTDAVLLFWILLHQVTPSWTELLSECAEITDTILIANPQWTRETKTVRLSDMREAEYVENTPLRKDLLKAADIFDVGLMKQEYRDSHIVWQWGITNRDLIETMKFLGFELTQYANYGRFDGLSNFDDCYFIFKRIRA